jgi:hypothetical protein
MQRNLLVIEHGALRRDLQEIYQCLLAHLVSVPNAIRHELFALTRFPVE